MGQSILIDVYCDRPPCIPVYVRTLPTSHWDKYSAPKEEWGVGGKLYREDKGKVQSVCA